MEKQQQPAWAFDTGVEEQEDEEEAVDEVAELSTGKQRAPAEISSAVASKKLPENVESDTEFESRGKLAEKQDGQELEDEEEEDLDVSKKNGDKISSEDSEEIAVETPGISKVLAAKRNVRVKSLEEENKEEEEKKVYDSLVPKEDRAFKARGIKERAAGDGKPGMKGGGFQVEEEEEQEVLDGKEEEEEESQQQMLLSEDDKVEFEDEDEDEDTAEDDDAVARDGSLEEQAAFTRELERFFRERNLEYKAPKFYGEELNVLKLWRAVTSLGGYEQVTSGKLWRKVGEQFKPPSEHAIELNVEPPKTCTTISWSFRGFYEKALLEYERYHTGAPYPISSQPDGTISGTDSYAVMSPTTPSAQANTMPASGSGRTRRDAATRAMHGWHTQRIGNGEVGEPLIKDRSGILKKEKLVKNLAGSKRKETACLEEQAVKVARAKGFKGRSVSLDEMPMRKDVLAGPGKSMAISKKAVAKPERSKHVTKVNSLEPMKGLKLVITDDGPSADWVKINAYRTSEGYEIYALVPGLAREEVRIQCEEGGRVVICGSPEQPNNPWG